MTSEVACAVRTSTAPLVLLRAHGARYVDLLSKVSYVLTALSGDHDEPANLPVQAGSTCGGSL